MKNINILLKCIIAFSCTTAPIAPALAAGGVDAGSGGGDPVLAFDQNQKRSVEAAYSLDYLKLTSAEIKKRDKALKPVYDNYRTVNVASVANALEKTFGLNVYHHVQNVKIDLAKSKNSKKELMAAAVRFFTGNQSPLSTAPDFELGYRHSLLPSKKGATVNAKLMSGSEKRFEETKAFDSNFAIFSTPVEDYDHIDFLFWDIPNDRSGVYSTTRDQLFEQPAVTHFLDAMTESNLRALDATIVFMSTQIRGDEYMFRECSRNIEEKVQQFRIGYKSMYPRGRDDVVKIENFPDMTTPIPDDVYKSIAGAVQLRGGQSLADKNCYRYLSEGLPVDTPSGNKYFVTDMGVSESIMKGSGQYSRLPYKVVYPTYSKLAPIPQPVIFISYDATTEDIMNMLAEHAPRIYAYNQLFDKNVLPKVAELNSILQKYPNFLSDVQKLNNKASRENIMSALHTAYLSVAYTTITAVGGAVVVPLTLVAMLASPVFYPLLVAQTVVILL